MKRLVTLILVLALSACATNGNNVESGAKMAADVDSSIDLKLGGIKKGRLTEEQRSRRYKIAVPSTGEYFLNIKSYCSCFGFKKKMFIPTIEVLDSSSKAITLTGGELAPGKTKGFDLAPAHLDVTWTAELTAGVYELVLSANVENLGQGIYPVHVFTGNYTLGSDIVVTSDSIGKYRIAVNTK